MFARNRYSNPTLVLQKSHYCSSRLSGGGPRNSRGMQHVLQSTVCRNKDLAGWPVEPSPGCTSSGEHFAGGGAAPGEPFPHTFKRKGQFDFNLISNSELCNPEDGSERAGAGYSQQMIASIYVAVWRQNKILLWLSSFFFLCWLRV